ncbi:15738_t:CDS:2 [Entrophospora sp. SA101]|nr:15738_t:CDS:2 [Entrophospora sp. SA101]
MSSLEEQINKLEKILSNNEAYINYLEKEISNRDEELEEIEILLQKSNDEMRLMTMAYYNEKEERRHWYFSYKDKHRRVGDLIREKFASKLVIHNYNQKFQQYRNLSRNLQQKLNTCQNDLFLNDIQIDNKWGKWKNRSRNYEQIIINQNQNILNLQNNIANQPNMATIHEIYLILHPPLIGFQADMVIPALYTHLPPDLRSTVKMYMSIRGGNTTIDNFFADLKKCWIERQAGNNSIQPTLINQQQTNNALDILANLAQRLGYSGDLTDYNQMQKYIENDLYRNYGRQIHNMKNEPFEPQRKIYATKQPASRKVIITNKNSRQCSICKKVGHTKINCPKLKRVRRVNNISQYENNENDENEEYIEYVEYDEEEIIDADNEEVILEDDENEYIDFEPQETNYENQVFLESIKYIISSLIPHCPKEILSELYAFIRKLFPEMENTFHSYYTKNYSSKERDMVWKNLIKKYQFILVPLIYIINSHKESQSQESITDNRPLNHAIKLYQEAQLIRDWPNPLEINFLQIKEPNNYATIPCKIYDLEIPHALLDTGSDGSHLSDNIADYIEKYFGLKMDRKKTYRLSGAVGEKQSIGTFHDIPITIGIGNDTVNISDEFSVLPTEKDHNGKDISLFILGTRWQHRAGWEPIVKGEFKASCNGKTITIPLSVHKPQQNVFSKATINNVEKKN